jgi:hypothetical protein
MGHVEENLVSLLILCLDHKSFIWLDGCATFIIDDGIAILIY